MGYCLFLLLLNLCEFYCEPDEGTKKAFQQQAIEMDKKYIYSKLKDKFLWEDERVENVVKKYDRAEFVPFTDSKAIYKDKYIYLGCGAEFSSPLVHSEALHILRNHLHPGANVLELGSGTGYLATCMAEMVKPNGSVIGMDLVEPLVDFSIKTTMRLAPDLVNTNILKFVVGDGRYGYAPFGPYDVIYTDCSHRSIPSVLLDQLKPGGRLVMTLGRTEMPQHLIVLDKNQYGGCSFARIRMRSKVPRLCSNMKEQDLYYQRMYPVKYAQHIPFAIDGRPVDYAFTTHKSRYVNAATKLNSEDLDHFAAAERRYQEKLDQIDPEYNNEIQLEPMLGQTTTKKKKSVKPSVKDEDAEVNYELWEI